MDNENEMENLFADAVRGDEGSTEEHAGGEAPEAAAPEAGQEPEKGGEPEKGQTEGGEPKGEKKPEQTPEERARHAESRRQREREQKAYNAGREAARAEFESTLGLIGFQHPKTKETVSTVDGLKKYAEELSDQRTADGTPTAADIRRFAREAAPKPENDAVERELAMIRELDPRMQELGDILRSDIGEAFFGYVQEGATFLQAYGRATREERAKAETAAKQQSADAAKAAGKEHLAATSTRGTGMVDVPAAELRLYRELNPGTSDTEIRKHYNEDRKRFNR